MTTKQRPVDFPEIQEAIYRVALSLDALLVNGIQQGVLHHNVFPGFLEKTEESLKQDLTSLEEQTPLVCGVSQPQVTAILASLAARCQQLMDLVTGLASFTTLPLQRLRSILAHIPLLRGECVQLIQELEARCHVPKPFYQSRPGHSTAAVDEFLANLDRAFVEAWNAANAGSHEN
jgi:16S rRNA C1402 (ribose-2'-O) methylase RsmI